jgi:hypothetical protein
MTDARLRLPGGLRHVLAVMLLALVVGACEGGSGQSGSAFSFLTVDGFSTSGTNFLGSIPSSTSNNSTTSACVTLRNNAKNPIIGPSPLDSIVVRSYTVTITPLTPGTPGGTFTFGTAVTVPAGVQTGTGSTATTAASTATLAVVLVPAGAKGPSGGSATVDITFKGQDLRGQSVKAEAAITVFFTGGDEPTLSCGTTTTPPTTTPPTTTPTTTTTS